MSKITKKKGQSFRHTRKSNGGCPHKSTTKKMNRACQPKVLAKLGRRLSFYH